MDKKPREAKKLKVKAPVKSSQKTTAEAIAGIEKTLNNERLLIYIQDTNIGPWDVLPIFNLLTEVGKTSNLNLILESRGGFSDDAYKIAGILHEFCDSLTVIVPFRAKSAATILSLAGNQILMSPIAELGPCDPMIIVDESLITPTLAPMIPQEREEVEGGKSGARKRQMNALALRDFLEVAGILQRNEAGEISGYDCNKLIPFCEKGVLNPWLLGDFERSFKQSSQFVENLLRRYMFKGNNDKLAKVPEIAQKLVEGYYLHEYPINRREAQEMGLIVNDMPDEIWKQISELMAAYNIMKKEQNLRTIIETSQSYHVEKRPD